jgi:hypothetical protein
MSVPSINSEGTTQETKNKQTKRKRKCAPPPVFNIFFISFGKSPLNDFLFQA